MCPSASLSGRRGAPGPGCGLADSRRAHLTANTSQPGWGFDDQSDVGALVVFVSLQGTITKRSCVQWLL